MLHLTHFRDVVLAPIPVAVDPVGQEISVSITGQHCIKQVQGSF